MFCPLTTDNLLKKRKIIFFSYDFLYVNHIDPFSFLFPKMSLLQIRPIAKAITLTPKHSGKITYMSIKQGEGDFSLLLSYSKAIAKPSSIYNIFIFQKLFLRY